MKLLVRMCPPTVILLFAIALNAQTNDSLLSGIQDLCWSPDGNYLFFSGMWHKPDYSGYRPSNWSIYRYDFDTRSVRKLIDSAFNVSVSSSGDRLAVGLLVGGNRDFFLFNLDGKNLQRLTTDSTEDFGAAWSPDDAKLAFCSKRSVKTQIYTMSSAGTNVQQLTKNESASSYSPAWSPDGSKIVYYSEKGDGRDQLHVAAADGSNDHNITLDSMNNVFPGWIDSSTIIYSQAGRDSAPTVFKVKYDGTEKRQIPALESFYARYSKDLSKIAYITGEVSQFIKIVDSNGNILVTIHLPR